jgi:hypothetical protein
MGIIIDIITKMIPAKLKTRINALGTNIATNVAGMIISIVAAMFLWILPLIFFTRSFSKISLKAKPTPTTDVMIAKNETIHTTG